MRSAALLLALALLAQPVHAQSQFTFAWPLDERSLKPRGASTRGAPVVLDQAPAPAWQ